MKKYLTIILGMVLSCGLCHAQDIDNDFLDDGGDFESFRQSIHKDFESFRQKINEEFADFMRNPWKEFKEERPVPKPKEDVVPPVIVPKDEPAPVNPTPKPIPFEDVVPAPKPTPQPKPIEPIEEIPTPPVAPVQPTVSFSFFGTTDKVRFDKSDVVRLTSLSENAIADAWLKLSEEPYTNLLYDCLSLRQTYKLCDWAYLQMLREVSETLCGRGTNESVLLMAYAYCQSGYQMRMAVDGTKLRLLVASKHHIYDIPYYKVDNVNYYPFLRNGETINNTVRICSVAYPKEKAMSLLVSSAQEFAANYKGQRTIKSSRYPNAIANVKVNQNLISFYNTYPTSMVDDNFMTRWAMYANTPMAKDVSSQLYPQVKKWISGKGQLEAANIILNWVQTGFEYEYDDKVWGGDRAFFAEESLNYPYCDCEDRSILFTRLVRDLLGLKCILVYYPGHLASAVCFTEPVNGDYIQLNGRKYIVSDPTYIGASVGMTMPNMDNQAAKVILLE